MSTDLSGINFFGATITEHRPSGPVTGQCTGGVKMETVRWESTGRTDNIIARPCFI